MKAPTNPRELLDFLTDHPDVVTSCDRPGIPTGPRGFIWNMDGGLWFTRPDGSKEYVPIDCGKTAAETGLAFRPEGFDVVKFGVTIRFDYVAPGDVPS
jgi:hypothetical protein